MTPTPETIGKLRELILKSEGKAEPNCDCGIGVEVHAGYQGELTLPRVLMALGSSRDYYYFITTNGYIYKHIIGGGDEVICSWNLSFDAEGQTEETLLSIIKILEV